MYYYICHFKIFEFQINTTVLVLSQPKFLLKVDVFPAFPAQNEKNRPFSNFSSQSGNPDPSLSSY